MNANDYQKYVQQGASSKYDDPSFAMVALLGELGEVADLIKKRGIYTQSDVDYAAKIHEETGDLIWQVFALLNSLNLSFDKVIEANVEKLNTRHGGATLDKTGGKR